MSAAAGPDSAGAGLGGSSTGNTGATTGRAWLAALPGELAAQRRVMAGLIEFCEVTPPVTSLSVGCSLGRGAADALSDIDAALGVAAERGDAGAGQVQAVEAMVVAALPGLGALVDVLRPWHGLSQVLDHDPRNLPPDIKSTVAGLDTADLRRATRVSAALLTKVSASAAQRCPADLPSAMAAYVTHALARDR